MKTDMRRNLARQPFEEKIRKVGQLIKLSADVKAQRVREDTQIYRRSGYSLPAVAETSPSVELPPKDSKK